MEGGGGNKGVNGCYLLSRLLNMIPTNVISIEIMFHYRDRNDEGFEGVHTVRNRMAILSP